MMKSFLSCLLVLLLWMSCEKKSENSTENSSKIDTLHINGKIINFTKFSKKLPHFVRDKSVYDENYTQKISKIVEYYLENSQQSLVKYQLENPNSNLGFSMEEQEKDGRNFTMIGIFNKKESNVSTIQWLFYDPKTKELFEYDLASKKMIKVEW